MKFEAPDFIAYYRHLWLKILEMEFGKERPDGAKREITPIVWIKGDKAYTDRMEELVTGFKPKGNPVYLHRIYLKCVADGAAVKVDDLVIYKTLKYMGYRSVIDNHQNDVEKKSFDVKILDDLYGMFKNEHINKYHQLDEELVEEAAGENLRKTPEVTEKVKPSEHAQVKQRVMRYLDNISLGHYNNAWELLTLGFQEEHGRDVLTGKPDFQKFAESHRMIKGISDIQILGSKGEGDAVKVLVHYIDKIKVYPQKDLEQLRNITLGDLNEFLSKVRSFKRGLEKLSPNKADEIEIWSLFSPGFSEHLRCRLKLSEDQLKGLSKQPKTEEARRLCEITCHRVQGDWKIHLIEAAEAWPDRSREC